MEFKNTLNKIKTLLSIEVKLEQMTLADGITVLEAESFEPGYSVGIVTPEGIVPAPIGEHETIDGMIVVVEVEGIIKEVKPVATAEAETEVEVEVEASAEVPAIKKVVDTITKETFFEEVKVEVEKLEAENKALKVELEAIKLELEEAGAKAIVTNPEPAVKREMTALEKFRIIKQNLK